MNPEIKLIRNVAIGLIVIFALSMIVGAVVIGR